MNVSDAGGSVLELPRRHLSGALVSKHQLQSERRRGERRRGETFVPNIEPLNSAKLQTVIFTLNKDTCLENIIHLTVDQLCQRPATKNIKLKLTSIS